MQLEGAEPVRVVVADDHPLYREGVRAVFAAEPSIELVGVAGDGRGAVERATELQPDVVVIDIRMPTIDGIEATRRIVAASPHIGVLVLTMYDDERQVFAALKAGARGYLLKESPGEDLIRAVHAVARGEVILGPAVARRVLDEFLSGGPASPPDPFPQLTAREREILELLASGRNGAQVARALGLQAKTVRNHVSNILNKLQVADRTEAILRAREAGLGGEYRPHG